MATTREHARAPRLAVAGALACWMGTFILSCLLFSRQDPGREHRESSAAKRLLGASRELLGARAYRMADTYYHRGVGEVRPRVLGNDFFQPLAHQVVPEHVAHLGAGDMKDIVPWLWFSLRLNPHNVDACLVAAFILGRQAERPDLAHRVLAEARWNNPSNYPVAYEEARLFLREHRTDKAEQRFNEALAFWPHPLAPSEPQAQLDLAAMLFYRALLLESENRIDLAIADLETLLRIQPGKASARERLESLRARAPPSLLASEAWSGMLTDHDESRACHDHDHEKDRGGSDHAHEDEH